MKQLPHNWLQCKLGDVVNYGSTNKVEPSDIPEDAWILELEDIERDTSRILQQITASQRKTKSTKNKFLTGDVLYGKLRPYLNKVVIAEKDGYCTTEIIPITPPSAIDKKYLLHWLKSPEFLNYTTASSHGLNMPRLGTDAGRNAPIPVPPLSEQKRIAEKLDALTSNIESIKSRLSRIPVLIRKLKQTILAEAYLGKLTADFRENAKVTPVSILLKQIKTPPRPSRFNSKSDKVIDGDYALSVGNPKKEIPHGWQWTQLVDIARMESGHTPSRSHTEYWDGAVPWVSIPVARDGHGKTIFDTYQKTNALGLANSAARLLPAGTVCLSRTASVGYVTRMGVPMATSQDFANWTCTEAIDPDWLKYLLVAETKAILSFGMGTTHTTVYYPELMAFHVALPPIEEQKEIVRRIDALFAFADALELKHNAIKKKIEKLQPLLLSKAFQGKLVHQCPNDETATIAPIGLENKKRQTKGKKSYKKTINQLSDKITELPDHAITIDEICSLTKLDKDAASSQIMNLLSAPNSPLKQVFDSVEKKIKFIKNKQ